MILKVGFCNINCLFRRRFKVRSVLLEHSLDFVGFTVTRLKPESSLRSSFFNGYTLYRHDRVLRRGGGVGFLCRSSYIVRPLSTSSEKICESVTDIPAEYALYHVSGPDIGFLLVLVVYRPPNSASFALLFERVAEFLCLAPRCLVMGDFNYDLGSLSSETANFLHHLEILGFHLTRFGNTYFDHNGGSELDVIGASEMNLGHPMILSTPLPGGHVFLSCSASYVKHVSPALPRPSRRRDWSNYTREDLVSSLMGCDWSIFRLQETSPDAMASYLTDCLSDALDRIAPWKTRRPLPVARADPWRNAHLKEMDRKATALYKKYQRNGRHETLIEYRELRRRVESYYSQLFNDFFRPRILRCRSQADIWALFERYGLLSATGSLPAFGVDPHAFAQFLTDLPGLPDPVPDLRGLISSWHEEDGGLSGFFFANITTSDVVEEALRLSSSRCTGLDGIHISYILDGMAVLGPLLADLFNAIISRGIYPTAWKRTVVRPIPKRPNPVAPGDFRPISLQSMFAKIFEGIVLRQITGFLNANDYFSPLQFGFRAGHSTEHAVLDFVERTRARIEDGNLVLVIFIDFTVAFNSLYPSAIIEAFLRAGFSRSSIGWLADSLSGRSFCIDTGGERSGFFAYDRGFGQGGRIGPILYLVGTNDFSGSLRPGTGFHLFADDSTIEEDCPPHHLLEALPHLGDSLKAVIAWSKGKGLIINPGKTTFVAFGRQSDIDRLREAPVAIFVDGAELRVQFEAKYLGVWLDSTFSWKRQARHLTSRVFGSLRRLAYLRPFLNQRTRVLLVRSLSLVHLDYCSSVLCTADSRTSSMLQVAQNACVRFAMDLPRRASVTPERAKMGLLDAADRRLYFSLVILFKVVHQGFPAALAQTLRLVPTTGLRRGRSASRVEFVLPRVRTGFGARSFSFGVVRFWNRLPVSINTETSLLAFKRRLFAYLAATPANLR